MSRLSLVVCLVAFGSLACSDDTKAPTPDTKAATPDAQVAKEATVAKDGQSAPEASFSELKPYDAVKGSASVKADAPAGVTKLELLVDGKSVATLTASPWTFTWDTAPTADGVVKLSLKASTASASSTSKELPVVVLNKGLEVTWKDGNTGTVTVPATGYIDQHIKKHYEMPDGVTKVIALLGWDQPGFKLELTIGVGECPDNGVIAAKGESPTSPVAVEYAPKTGTIPKAAMWFSHVQLMNPNDVLGKDTPFWLKTYLLK